jgi:hypothetical protein
VECGGPLSLSGPPSVATDGRNPRFVCRNGGEKSVRVAVGQWSVHRNDDGWTRVAAGRTGATTTLEPGEKTAWVLLLDDGRGQSLTTATTTRYVGPVSVRPGEYAFAVRGERASRQFAATATFTVE